MASENCVINILDLFTRSKFGTKIQDFQQTVEAWMLVLEPLGDDVVMRAAVTLARNDSDFVPSAGAVYQEALSLLDTEPGADEAWEHIVQYSKADSLPDADNPTKLTDREKRSLELMGGNCGDWLVKDYPFRRREFVEIYNAQERKWRDNAAMALPGGQAWKQLTG